MAKVKIISNPYKEHNRTRFQSFDCGGWIDINGDHSPNSALLGGDITEPFFPFNIEKILSTITKEYRGGDVAEPIQIEFAGTDEDYSELEHICQQSRFDSPIILSRSSEHLPNARDILPLIIEDFCELKDLLNIYAIKDDDESLRSYKGKVAKFEETSDETIPICVIGTYSAGKSTFINALIGQELLPSSDEVATSRIYKISRSLDQDCGVVEFECNEAKITLSLQGTQYSFTPCSVTVPIITELTTLLCHIQNEPLVYRLSQVLDWLNQYSGDDLSDLIKVTVPFSSAGLFGKTSRKFLIIDTPGSNNISDERHKERLLEAMEGLSNGLPIIVSSNDMKSAKDFAELYQTAAKMPSLDNRFTLLLINKADAANLAKPVCEFSPNIKRSGVYYLSSIMGLGFKTQGQFDDSHIEEVFASNKEKYINPENRYYHQLYTHNVLPPQIKCEYDTVAAQASDAPSLLYANSGLQHVELAIEHFADSYAPYNKCSCCSSFLQDMIQSALNQIDTLHAQKEKLLESTNAKFESTKENLINQLKDCKSKRVDACRPKLKRKLSHNGDAFIDECQTDKSRWKKQETAFQRQKYEEHDISSQKERRNNAFADIGRNIGDSFQDFDLRHIINHVGNAGKAFGCGVDNLFENIVSLHFAKENAKDETREALVSYAALCFKQDYAKYTQMLTDYSEAFFAQEDRELRDTFQRIIDNSSVLSEKNRDELHRIIENFIPSPYSVGAIFQVDKFTPLFLKKFLPMKHQKLATDYNDCLEDAITSANKQLEDYLSPRFEKWAADLLNNLIACLSTFNPDLHEIADELEALQQEIKKFQEHADELKRHSNKIQKLMAWQNS